MKETVIRVGYILVLFLRARQQRR